jgi:hypothetical protein
VPSLPALAKALPSGANATARTAPMCPVRVYEVSLSELRVRQLYRPSADGWNAAVRYFAQVFASMPTGAADARPLTAGS